MDAPIPGIERWNTIRLNPGVWHFNFHGPDAERLVAGREREESILFPESLVPESPGGPSFGGTGCLTR